jgi:SMC interacting uncharacterized protein involved in chromosome segregation
MARTTDLTQEKVSEIADGLQAKGIKPSPNTVRAELGTGSFSTIKQMLDVWKDKQKEEESIFVPETPDFAYNLVDKLHRELYLQNRRLLDSERQQLEISRQEYEDDKLEMITEIDNLENSIGVLNSDLEKKTIELQQASDSLQSLQAKFDGLINELNTQKIEIATLTEREKQQAIQLQEKDLTIKQAEKLEQSLSKQLEELRKKAK